MAEKSVLVIEDDPSMQEVVEDMIHSLDENADIVLSSDGFDGFHELRSKKFDLAIVDIELPYSRGDKLIRAVREKETLNKETAFILMSGKIIDRDLPDGSNTYLLEKPFTQAEFNVIARPFLVARNDQ